MAIDLNPNCFQSMWSTVPFVNDGSFVTAIGDFLKISPMTVTKESLDRVHCCHSHNWHIKNWNFHEMSLMSVKKVLLTLSTFVTAISDICCYRIRLLVPVLPDLSSLTVTKESLDRGHFCHSRNWYFCQSKDFCCLYLQSLQTFFKWWNNGELRPLLSEYGHGAPSLGIQVMLG